MEHEEGFNVEAAYIPWWTKENHIKDNQGRRPSDPQYDPTTIFVPSEEYKNLSPFMKQYWNIKSKYYNKLVGIQMGRFYVFHFQDAIIMHKLLDFRITIAPDSTAFWIGEKTLAKYSEKIFSQGYIFVLADQLDESKSGSETVAKREVTHIITKGTYTEHKSIGYASQFVACVYEDLGTAAFGVVLFDTTTHELYVGEFEDDSQQTKLRTQIIGFKPLEVIYMKDYLSDYSQELVKNSSHKPTLVRLFERNEPQSVTRIVKRIEKYVLELDSELPALLKKMKSQFFDSQSKNEAEEMKDELDEQRERPHFLAFQALALAIDYLENILLAQTVLPTSKFLDLIGLEATEKSMYLDDRAINTLELFEVDLGTRITEENTLFSYMDHTSSDFGRKMFRRWMTTPSRDVELLRDRQLAIEDLGNAGDAADRFQADLKRLNDIERLLGRIYNLRNPQRFKAYVMEDLVVEKLHDLLGFLKEMKKIEPLLKHFVYCSRNFKSKRLYELTNFKEATSKKKGSDEDEGEKKKKQKGEFPRIQAMLDSLEKMVVIEDKIPYPAPGIDRRCDELRLEITQLKEKLEEILDEQKKRFKNSSIKYYHAKLRYQIEIPEHLVEGKKPSDFIITSKKKGFQRFQTEAIEKHVWRIEALEKELRKNLLPFLFDYVKAFYERRNTWNQVIAYLAELDCLCSLAKLALKMDVRCKPVFLDDTSKPVYKLKGMVHPCLLGRVKDFVRNDIVFEKEIMLITGPNMGGKSTTLRQASIAIIMAQMGSYVPATEFTLTPFDRIFTRIGASDQLILKKSTFFIELEETLQIVKEATAQSFVIIDELGRGTSTYDGIAIAYAVLVYLADHKKCLTMFTTHYHTIVDTFKSFKNVENYHMGYELDEKKDSVRFLYKFQKGTALSFGLNVAKLADLPNEVLEIAKEKAEMMRSETGNMFSEKFLSQQLQKSLKNLKEITNETCK